MTRKGSSTRGWAAAALELLSLQCSSGVSQTAALGSCDCEGGDAGEKSGGGKDAEPGSSESSESSESNDAADNPDLGPSIEASAGCPGAAGSWTATLPPFGGTTYVVTFQISSAIALSGGSVEITWSSPGVTDIAGTGAFSANDCTLAEPYAAFCAAELDAGGGGQCGDEGADADVCPSGDALTASFGVDAFLSIWTAQGCSPSGTGCVNCVQHEATSVVSD